MMNIQYGETRIEVPNEDGTFAIFTNGYFDGPKSVKEQTREDIKTSERGLLKDIISCLEALKTNTPELMLVIKKDKNGRPILIQKTWTISKKKID